jgi:PAS domain S-box-containing protein
MMTNVEALTSFVAGRGTLEDTGFREMVEILPVAIYTTDAEGRLTYFNAAAAKLSGRIPELGTDQWCVSWKIFLPDGTPLPHDQCPMAVALRGGEVPNGIECIAERPDGTRFWFSPSPAVLRDAEGWIVGGINVLFDITDRKNAELEAAENFRAIVAATPECVKIVASDGTLLFMNPPGLRMMGASTLQAVIGKSVYDLVAPEHREAFGNFHRRVCMGEEGSLAFDTINLQGERRHMEAHAAPFQRTDNTIVYLAVTRDVTDRKRAEHDAMLLGAIVDSSDDSIISKDLEGTITSWNKSAERLFGYTASETIGQPVTILIPPERLDEEPEILDRLRRGERVDHFETVRKTKDGRLIDISLTISPVKDRAGNVIGASKIARDITEHRRTEEALRASQASFRQLADSMPHMV